MNTNKRPQALQQIENTQLPNKSQNRKMWVKAKKKIQPKVVIVFSLLVILPGPPHVHAIAE